MIINAQITGSKVSWPWHKPKSWRTKTWVRVWYKSKRRLAKYLADLDDLGNPWGDI